MSKTSLNNMKKSSKALQIHKQAILVNNIKTEIDIFGGNRTNARYQDLHKILATTSIKLQDLKSKTQKSNNRDYCEEVQGQIQQCIKRLESRASFNGKKDLTPYFSDKLTLPEPTLSEITEEESCEFAWRLAELEEESDRLEMELKGFIDLSDAKQLAYLEKQIRGLYNQLECVSAMPYTPLGDKKLAIGKRLIKYNNQIKKIKRNIRRKTKSYMNLNFREPSDDLVVTAEDQLGELEEAVISFKGVKDDDNYRELQQNIEWQKINLHRMSSDNSDVGHRSSLLMQRVNSLMLDLEEKVETTEHQPSFEELPVTENFIHYVEAFREHWDNIEQNLSDTVTHASIINVFQSISEEVEDVIIRLRFLHNSVTEEDNREVGMDAVTPTEDVKIRHSQKHSPTNSFSETCMAYLENYGKLENLKEPQALFCDDNQIETQVQQDHEKNSYENAFADTSQYKPYEETSYKNSYNVEYQKDMLAQAPLNHAFYDDNQLEVHQDEQSKAAPNKTNQERTKTITKELLVTNETKIGKQQKLQNTDFLKSFKTNGTDNHFINLETATDSSNLRTAEVSDSSGKFSTPTSKAQELKVITELVKNLRSKIMKLDEYFGDDLYNEIEDKLNICKELLENLECSDEKLQQTKERLQKKIKKYLRILEDKFNQPTYADATKQHSINKTIQNIGEEVKQIRIAIENLSKPYEELKSELEMVKENLEKINDENNNTSVIKQQYLEEIIKLKQHLQERRFTLQLYQNGKQPFHSSTISDPLEELVLVESKISNIKLAIGELNVSSPQDQLYQEISQTIKACVVEIDGIDAGNVAFVREQKRKLSMELRNCETLLKGKLPDFQLHQDKFNKIRKILLRLSDVETQINNFSGNKNDPRYSSLDELLVTLMIELNNVETHSNKNLEDAKSICNQTILKSIKTLSDRANTLF